MIFTKHWLKFIIYVYLRNHQGERVYYWVMSSLLVKDYQSFNEGPLLVPPDLLLSFCGYA